MCANRRHALLSAHSGRRGTGDGIVRAMKEFAHPDQREQSSANLNKALLNTLTVARNECKYVADIEIDLDELPPVSCYLSDLNQVFLNLVANNAAHAIGDVVDDSRPKGRSRSAAGRWAIRWKSPSLIPAAAFPRRSATGFSIHSSPPNQSATAPGRVCHRPFHCGGQASGIKLTFETVAGQGTTFYIRLPVDGQATAGDRP